MIHSGLGQWERWTPDAGGAGFSSHCSDGQRRGQVWAALCCFSWSLLLPGWAPGCGQQEEPPDNISVSWGCDPRNSAASVSLSSGNAPFPLLHFEVTLESQQPWGTQGTAKLAALTQLRTEQGSSPAFEWGLFHLPGAAEGP